MHTKNSIITSFLLANKGRVLLTFLSALFANVLTLLLMISIGKYFELLFDYNATRAQVLDIFPSTFFDTVPHFMVFFGVLVGLRFVFYFLERFQTGVLGERLVRSLREQLFEHQLYLNMRIYDQDGTGKYLLRYSGDLKSVQNYVTKGIIRFASDAALLVLAMSTILWLNPQLVWPFLICIAAILIITALLNRSLYNVSVKRRDTRSGMLSFVSSRLNAMLSIKSFNKERPELNKFKRRSERLYNHGVNYHRIYNLIFSGIPMLLYVLLGAVLWTTYNHQQLYGEISETALLGSILIILSMMPIFRRTLRVSVVWKIGNISFNKLIAILRLEQEENRSNPDLELENGAVKLKNLDFGFESAKPLFKALDLAFKPGEINVVQGKIGQGKSSLIKLLLGIYTPDSGVITIDDKDLANSNPKSIRRNIAVVSDDWPLLGKTVFEAISYSRKSEKRIGAEKMLNQLQESMPKKLHLTLDDTIGNQGAKLSKGQKKLLNYARALLTKKPILVIDDPFNGLDKETRKHVGEILDRIKKKRTIIVLNQGPLNGYLKTDHELQLQTTK